jgi:hypothetical protein
MDKLDEALGILKINIEAFPNSTDAKRCFDWVSKVVQVEKYPVILSTDKTAGWPGSFFHVRAARTMTTTKA